MNKDVRKMTIIEETIQTLDEFIPNVISASRNLAENLRKGESLDTSVLSKLLEAIQWCLSAIEGLQKNNSLTGIPLAAITEPLGELEEALENQDHIMIADLLEYEIAAVFEEWLTVIKNNREH